MDGQIEKCTEKLDTNVMNRSGKYLPKFEIRHSAGMHILRISTSMSQMKVLQDLGFHNDEENAHFLAISNGNLDVAVNLILAERERMTMD
ncbi:hypothetical protein T10_6873 [Trichinella papuae]|uniref:UBA domain-containing protein n=1 Tax=Trichinella papuae TaxID=268474 RepID=A0A0V1MF88_9BILA|nr:hypothetical protein T10_6873 [Trichinella papuae]